MKDLKIYIGIGSVLLLIYMIAQFNRPNPVNWTATLSYADKIPYGTYVLYHRLNDIYPESKIERTNKSAYSIFSDSTFKPGNYLMVATNVTLSEEDTKAMLNYVSAGNSVFISSFEFDGTLSDTLKLSTGTEYDKKEVALNFTNPKLKRAAAYAFDNSTSSQYFNTFDTTKAIVLSQNEKGKANYLRFPFGKGNLYLFANPQLLTNYSLLKNDGADYAAKVLSYLPESNIVYWDQFQNHDIQEDKSPMRVFFSHPPLQWAYYISLATLLLFVLYEIKRRQRIIPVIDPLKNSTVEFVSVVGRVYYEQRDNRDIAAKKIVYFAEHLRSAFGLKTGAFNSEFLQSLINKTGIDEALARQLVNHINFMSHQTQVSDHELIVLNHLIENFYIQSGSYGK